MKRVEVVWTDIVHENGWHDADELDNYNNEKARTVRQLGYMYEQDEETVTLIDSYFEDKSLFGTIHILPRGCIKEIIEI
jgi:hypothetical protein